MSRASVTAQPGEVVVSERGERRQRRGAVRRVVARRLAAERAVSVDPRDRDTWLYRECDVCLQPVCEKHSAEEQGRILCDRCRRQADAQQRSAGLIDLGLPLHPEPE